ncbi:hypothetical protein Taro_035872 [Colocasia esculenta]|uniref:Uncharacterized protein n=1 Tax=Colocasia esculenta TaxID=4460 RepID=A0A843W1J5_COLES|nr:hypothetical protein [Colocasia esculenta]
MMFFTRGCKHRISQRNIKTMRIWPNWGRTNTAQQVPGESTRFATIQGESDRIRANPIRPESAHQQTMLCNAFLT